MITLVVEGRKPLFGRLQGDGLASMGSENEPKVVLSPLGKAIQNFEIQKIPTFYPMVEVWKLCIMPDHLHGARIQNWVHKGLVGTQRKRKDLRRSEGDRSC